MAPNDAAIICKHSNGLDRVQGPSGECDGHFRNTRTGIEVVKSILRYMLDEQPKAMSHPPRRGSGRPGREPEEEERASQSPLSKRLSCSHWIGVLHEGS